MKYSYQLLNIVIERKHYLFPITIFFSYSPAVVLILIAKIGISLMFKVLQNSFLREKTEERMQQSMCNEKDPTTNWLTCSLY